MPVAALVAAPALPSLVTPVRKPLIGELYIDVSKEEMCVFTGVDYVNLCAGGVNSIPAGSIITKVRVGGALGKIGIGR